MTEHLLSWSDWLHDGRKHRFQHGEIGHSDYLPDIIKSFIDGSEVRHMDTTYKITYLVTMAYQIWSRNLHYTNGSSIDLALLALNAIQEESRPLLVPNLVLWELQAIGCDNRAGLIKYPAGHRRTVSRPFD